jgi:L-rhamnose mutarotase
MMPEIVDLLGHAAAARLALAFNGREIRVPTRRHGRTWDALVQAIGEHDAARFCDYFQGERVYVASSQRMHTEHNRRRAAEMRAQGKTWDEVGKALGYSARGARKLLTKGPGRTAAAMLDAIAERETPTPQ